jgi:hypothetical protein
MKTLADFKRRICVSATISVIENTFYPGAYTGPRTVAKIQTNAFAMRDPRKGDLVWQYYQGAEGWTFDGSNRVTRRLPGRTGHVIYELLPPGEAAS